jgi:hypothetical protein
VPVLAFSCQATREGTEEPLDDPEDTHGVCLEHKAKLGDPANDGPVSHAVNAHRASAGAWYGAASAKRAW